MDENVAVAGPTPEAVEDKQVEQQPAAPAAEKAEPKAAPVTDILSTDDGEPYEPTDVFAWANNLYQFKDQLKIELFLINKNNVMYRTKVSEDLDKQLQPLFINGLLDFVLQGAAEGLVVRGFEDAEEEDNVLQRTAWKNVDKLKEVMHWIRTQEDEIELFVEQEHDMKRMKAVMARVSHPKMSEGEPFYVIKQLPRSQVMKGEGAWMVMGKVFMPFEEGASTLRIPAGNELLVVNQDLFVFNQPKLERLFGYNAKKNSIAAKKVAEIEARFKLAFSEGMDLQTLVKDNKSAINKLQRLEMTDDIKQDTVMDHAEEMGVELMMDEDGAIILENGKDLTKFVNLINDDYVESNLTGLRYEIKGKRELRPEDNKEEV